MKKVLKDIEKMSTKEKAKIQAACVIAECALFAVCGNLMNKGSILGAVICLLALVPVIAVLSAASDIFNENGLD